MENNKIKVSGTPYNKLMFVKLIKELCGLGLKDAKELADPLDGAGGCIKQDFIELDIMEGVDIQKAVREILAFGLSATYTTREKKMKRILYADQEVCIKDMLNDISNWSDHVDEEDRKNLTYNQCREKAVQKIYDEYEEYLKIETFNVVYNDIKDVNKSETKPVEVKIIKFNEEYGELCAEFLKLKGYTYKPYDKEELCNEMADALQVLLSIYSDIEEETGITINAVLNSVMVKNEKWRNKIKEYTNGKQN